MSNILNFVLSRFGLISSDGLKRERISFVLSRIFPLANPELLLKRILNLFAVFFAWKKGILLWSVKPVILQIESVRGCNFNCIMCRAGVSRKKYMDMDKLKFILSCFPESFIVIFNWVGEPFLSENLFDMIKYMSYDEKRIVTLSSNFSIMKDPYEILDSGIYEINASIDSFDPLKFQKIREWGNLEKVVSNLKSLIQAKKNRNTSLPIVSISAISSKETIGDAEDIIRSAIEIGVDRVKFQKLIFSTSELSEPDENDFKYLRYLQKKYSKKIDVMFNGFPIGGDPPQGYCFFAYFNATVDVFGNVHTCYMPFNLSNSTFGNIFSDHRNVKRERYKFIKKFRKEPPEFCSNCYLYKRDFTT